MDTLDVMIWIFGIGLVLAFVYILWSYARGLKGSPRELYILFLTKVLEYSAYGAMNMSFILYLSADCGLGDISAGTYIGIWSTVVTTITMLVGAVVDAIGIKKTLIVGTIVLLFSRLFMPLTDNIYFVTLVGFLPMAIGIAIMGPVLSVGIKRYTTKDSVALGFGLFYTLMNVGWAAGGIIFDWIRGIFGEHEMVSLPVLPMDMSTYQIIFAVGFIITVPTMILVLLMRDGIEMHDDGSITIEPPTEREQGSVLAVFGRVVKKAAVDTVNILKKVVRQKAFWYYLFMLGILVFVRLTFYHFHYTFPKYGIRVLGEGVKIGNIYGVLNPTMIVFLVPFIAAMTRKISSYKMMMVGTTISAFSIFIATFPAEMFQPLVNTWFGELIYGRWLDVPMDQRQPVYLALVIFISIFTIGEAFWSPRLMQFAAEIAPKGNEGTYISLSYLPYFAAKLIAGPLSGWLVATYTPEGAGSYPNHYMVWVWIGAMAAISPLGLVVFRKLFRRAEQGSVADVEG